MKIHPTDVSTSASSEAAATWCESSRAAVCVRVAITDEVRQGLVSLPHGFGMFEGNATDTMCQRSGD